MHNHPPFAKRVAACSHGFLSKAEAGRQLVPTLRRLLEAETPQVCAALGPPTNAMRYAWQQTVADAFVSAANLLPATINLAERAIAARLTDANEPDPQERTALKEALGALRQLISETKPARDESPEKSQEKGVA